METTYACGHVGEVVRTAWGLPAKCPTCTKTYRQERSRIAAEKAVKEGLSPLEGTLGSIRFAEVLRMSVVKRLNKVKVAPILHYELPTGGYGFKTSSKAQRDILPSFIFAHDSYNYFTKEECQELLDKKKKDIVVFKRADYWINNVEKSLYSFLTDFYHCSIEIDDELTRLITFPPQKGDVVMFKDYNRIISDYPTIMGSVIHAPKDTTSIRIQTSDKGKYTLDYSRLILSKLIRKDNYEGMLFL